MQLTLRHMLYLCEPRAVLVEQRLRVLAPERLGWHIDRYVLVADELHLRGQRGMYPALPQVEPVEISAADFAEAWDIASN